MNGGTAAVVAERGEVARENEDEDEVVVGRPVVADFEERVVVFVEDAAEGAERAGIVGRAKAF